MATSGILSQEVVKVLVAGAPSGQLSQEVVKVLVGGTPAGQLSQLVVKVLIDSTFLSVTTTLPQYKLLPTIN